MTFISSSEIFHSWATSLSLAANDVCVMSWLLAPVVLRWAFPFDSNWPHPVDAVWFWFDLNGSIWVRYLCFGLDTWKQVGWGAVVKGCSFSRQNTLRANIRHVTLRLPGNHLQRSGLLQLFDRLERFELIIIYVSCGRMVRSAPGGLIASRVNVNSNDS